MANRDFLERLSKRLADDGRLVEAGWVGLRLAVGLEHAPAEQLREMRLAFMGGAQHLFSSIMTVLDPGEDPTQADLRRFDLINAELTAAAAELTAELHRVAAARKPVQPEPVERLGDAPIEQAAHEIMNNVARLIDRAANRQVDPKVWGFVLMLFKFGADGRCNYISNAAREDVVVLLREQLRHFEGAPDVEGTA